MSYQIFISYRREGGEALAYLINERLSAAGYKVFYDMESLTSGKFNTKLLEVIDVCEDILVVLPPRALDRCIDENDWLRLEIIYALKKGKNIIPVMMKGFDWPDTMPEEMLELKNYNGVAVTFDFFDGVMMKIVKYLTTTSKPVQNIDSDMSLKHILFWGDFDNANIEKIVGKLELGDNFYVEILDDPLEILTKNLGVVHSIILIITDCTKFSTNSIAVQRINMALTEYVRRGGKLISAHDVIYRRTKNELLQNMYGCKIAYFKQIDTVHYKKTSECLEEGAFSSLPEEFDLHDAEICWGDLAEDVEIYFETEDGIPLVFSREYGRGVCIYLNSGEFKERPPRSILKPEKDFVKLIRESILMKH